MHALRVNKTKITSKNGFLENIFELECEKHSKKAKRSSSETGRRFLTFLSTLRSGMPHIRGFLDYFSFSHF